MSFANSENSRLNAFANFHNVEIWVSVSPRSNLDNRPLPMSYSKENLLMPLLSSSLLVLTTFPTAFNNFFFLLSRTLVSWSIIF